MKYQTEVDLEVENSSQSEIARTIIERLQPGASVLDVGCAGGDLGAALVSAGYTVTGIENDPARCERAATRLSRVYEKDIDDDSIRNIVSEQFDAIIFGDVLEHVRDPQSVLCEAADLLNPEGFICASIPNIAHGTARIALLEGRWDYKEEGLFDRTHMRFFTHDSIVEMLHGTGFVIDSFKATVVRPASGFDSADSDHVSIPDEILNWILEQETSFDYQYVVVAHPASQEEIAASRVPDVIRLAPVDRPLVNYDVSYQARSYQQAVVEQLRRELDEFERERYELLTVRDYAIGMEHELGRVRYDLNQRDEIEHQLRMEIIQTHARLADAIADGQRLRKNPVFRFRSSVGRVLRKVGLR